MVLDADAPERLWDEILTIIQNPDTLRLLSENISKLALRDSDERIVDRIQAIVGC